MSVSVPVGEAGGGRTAESSVTALLLPGED